MVLTHELDIDAKLDNLLNSKLMRATTAVVLFALFLLPVRALGQTAALAISQPEEKLEMKSGYAPFNGLTPYYEIHGTPNPARSPLVLLHSGGATITTDEIFFTLSRDRLCDGKLFLIGSESATFIYVYTPYCVLWRTDDPCEF